MVGSELPIPGLMQAAGPTLTEMRGTWEVADSQQGSILWFF